METFKERISIYLNTGKNGAEADKLFHDIWQNYHPRLIIFSRSFLPSFSHEAEEIVQEIMFRVFKNIGSYNPLFAFSTWLYRIARNFCIDYSRKHGKQQFQEEHPVDIESLQPVSTLNSPADAFVNKDQQEKIETCLSRLPSSYQTMAFLRFYEQLPYRIIAEMLDIPTGTIKAAIHKIRKELAHVLEEYYETN